MSVRAFFAVDLPDDIRAALARAMRQLPLREAGARAVSPENLHVTLHFLGQIDDGEIVPVQELAQQAAAEVEPFKIEVGGLIAVPPAGKRLRMIWGGLTDATGRLGQLNAALGRRLREVGFEIETRPFSPHITMARFRSTRGAEAVRTALAPLAGMQLGLVDIDRLVLYSSELTKTGPIYAPLASVGLGQAG